MPILASLRARILAVALAPCLAFAGAAGLAVSDQWARRAEMDRFEGLVGLASRISAFVHEAQRERGASSLFLGAQGAQFGPELAAQRRRTDAALAALSLRSRHHAAHFRCKLVSTCVCRLPALCGRRQPRRAWARAPW